MNDTIELTISPTIIPWLVGAAMVIGWYALVAAVIRVYGCNPKCSDNRCPYTTTLVWTISPLLAVAYGAGSVIYGGATVAAWLGRNAVYAVGRYVLGGTGCVRTPGDAPCDLCEKDAANAALAARMRHM